MDYEVSDSSGTDDDLPPSHQNRFSRAGRASGNGKSAGAGSGPFSRIQNDMEAQIHHIEQEAYSSVLRAFKAQSDAITWEKESLITELRKELRVSDEEHRELLSKVNADDIIRRIREWRKAGGPGMLNASHEPIPSPTVSATHKKQKTSQSAASMPFGAPPHALHPSMQPSSSTMKRGPSSSSRAKKSKAYPSAGVTGRGPATNRDSSGACIANEATEGSDSLLGRKVWTRWPEDNHFYEAVITDYNPLEGRHALVYDISTADETWEWVNLKEISPEDIRWEGEDPGVSRRVGRQGTSRGVKKGMSRGGPGRGGGRGRATAKGQSKKDFPSSINGIAKKASSEIEILHTDSLIKEVEKIFGASNPDPVEIEKARKVLKEHEQALVDAIAMLEEASDGESDGEGPFLQGQSMDQDQGRTRQQYEEMGGGEGRVIAGSIGHKRVNGQQGGGGDDMI